MADQYPKLVHKQFNSPMGLYSNDNIREVIDREAQMLGVGPNYRNPHAGAMTSPANLQNSAVLRLIKEEAEKSQNGEPPILKRVAWPPPEEGGRGHLESIPVQEAVSSLSSQSNHVQSPNQSRGFNSQQSQLSNRRYSASTTSYKPTLQYTNLNQSGQHSAPLSPVSNQTPTSFSPVPSSRPWAPSNQTPTFQRQLSNPVQSNTQPDAPKYLYLNQGPGPQQHYQPPQKLQYKAPQQNQPKYQPSPEARYQPPQPQYQPSPEVPYQAPQQQYQAPQQQYQAPQQQYQAPQPQYQAPQQQYQPPQPQYQSPQQEEGPKYLYLNNQSPGKPQTQMPHQQPREYIIPIQREQSPPPSSPYTQPQHQTQSGAPAQLTQQQPSPQSNYPQQQQSRYSTQQQQPQSLSNNQQYIAQQQQKYFEPPPTTIHLKSETPVSQIPVPVYTSQPATATLRGGKHLRGDLKWPPPECKQKMEEERLHEIEIHQGAKVRPRKNCKDYTDFFNQHALNSTYPGYKIPPGTQYYFQQRTMKI